MARQFIRQWQKRARLSATETAAYLGLKLPAFSQLMNDYRRQPSLRTAIRFRDLIGVPVDAWLLQKRSLGVNITPPETLVEGYGQAKPVIVNALDCTGEG